MGMAIFLPSKDHKVNDLVGTLQYMAPEVLEGKHYGFAADLWSIGKIYYFV
jgi:serine/threonine protein kinase